MFAEDDDQIDGLADEPINAIDLFGEEEADPQLLPPLSPSAENVDQQGDGEEASTATKKVRKQINRAPTLNPLWYVHFLIVLSKDIWDTKPITEVAVQPIYVMFVLPLNKNDQNASKCLLY